MRHTRTLFARPGCWFVVDRIAGAGHHRAAVHWHLDPAWTAAAGGEGRVRADHPDGTRVWLLSVGHELSRITGSRTSQDPGWYSPCYGVIQQTTALVASQTGPLPHGFLTIVVEAQEAPAIERLDVTSGGRPAPLAVAVRLSVGDVHDTVIFAGPSSERVDAVGAERRHEAGGLVTDAALLCCRATEAQPMQQVLMVDGRSLHTGDGRALVELPSAAPTIELTVDPAGAAGGHA
jgi:hypothetical protein